MAKDYATETDVFTIADPVFGTGDKVTVEGVEEVECKVIHSQWDTLNHTWTYFIEQARHFHIAGASRAEVPEAKLKAFSVRKTKVAK